MAPVRRGRGPRLAPPPWKRPNVGRLPRTWRRVAGRLPSPRSSGGRRVRLALVGLLVTVGRAPLGVAEVVHVGGGVAMVVVGVAAVVGPPGVRSGRTPVGTRRVLPPGPSRWMGRASTAIEVATAQGLRRGRPLPADRRPVPTVRRRRPASVGARAFLRVARPPMANAVVRGADAAGRRMRLVVVDLLVVGRRLRVDGGRPVALAVVAAVLLRRVLPRRLLSRRRPDVGRARARVLGVGRAPHLGTAAPRGGSASSGLTPTRRRLGASSAPKMCGDSAGCTSRRACTTACGVRPHG